MLEQTEAVTPTWAQSGVSNANVQRFWYPESGEWVTPSHAKQYWTGAERRFEIELDAHRAWPVILRRSEMFSVLSSFHKTIALLGLLAVTATGVYAQTEVWVATYNGVGDQNDATAMALTKDNAVVVTGYSVGPDYSRDIVTIKYDRMTGQDIWTTRWLAGANTRDEGWDIATDTLGNVFVTGKVGQTSGDTDMVTLKMRGDNGQVVWSKVWNSIYHSVDIGTSVIPDQRGGVFTVGHSSASAGNGNQDYLIYHYGSAGESLWAKRLDGVGHWHDVTTRAIMDRAGALYVTGYSWGGATPQYDYWTVKLDTARHDTVWTRRYDGTATAPKSDYAMDITLDDSGYVYVTGRAGEVGTWYDATTIKYRPDGSTVWTNRFDAGWLGTDGGGNVRVDHNFNVYVGGIVLDAINDMYDYLTVKIHPNNTVEWFRTYDGGVEDDDSLTALQVDDKGNVYVTGYTYVYQGDMDWMTIKYSPSGTELWRASHATFEDDDWPFDMAMANNEIYVTGFDFSGPDENYCTVKYTEDDVGAVRFVLPADTFRLGATVRPKAWVRNYGALTSRSFSARCEIGGFYFDAQMVDTIPAYDSVLVTFSPWLVEDAAVGPHQARCYTMLDVDKERTNDTCFHTVTGVAAWQRLPDLPAGIADRPVKDGGALGFVPDSMVYAFKGNNTVEFYGFNVLRDAWVTEESIPAVGHSGKKKVKGGSHLAYDGSRYLYALKGNNSVEFWKYDASGNQWTQDVDYPLGASGRKVKAGATLVSVPERGAFYSAKGASTFEFYCYDIGTHTWVPKSPVPSATNKKCKEGTVMGYDGHNTIYLLKGGTYEFYAYKISADSWYTEKPIRNTLYEQKKRKVKKGAAAAYDTLFDKFYVLKGSKCGEFWFFDVARDSWTEWPNDSFPTPAGSKPPYSGAALCYGDGKIYVLRGNRTDEFWRYNASFPLMPDSSQMGPQSGASSVVSRLELRVVPNPFRQRTTLRYSLPHPARVTMVMYDAVGRQVRSLVDGWRPAGTGNVMLQSDGLAGGVYLVRLRVATLAGASEVTSKILITP
jgi:hypothetical protein